MKTRCKKGYRKCFKGKCTRKKQKVSGEKRCKTGSRKCANRVCYKTPKKSMNRSYTLRNRTVKY